VLMFWNLSQTFARRSTVTAAVVPVAGATA
jgi:hypothetical protein